MVPLLYINRHTAIVHTITGIVKQHIVVFIQQIVTFVKLLNNNGFYKPNIGTHSMSGKSTKSPEQISPSTSSIASDKKIHTAGLGFALLILTNYQAEVKQILQLIIKWVT
ncbi:hypothetical protein EBS02_00750 [bacterium]|nr:hypothetical protein [bacterium]